MKPINYGNWARLGAAAGLAVVLSACQEEPKETKSETVRVDGSTVTLPPHSEQMGALEVSPVLPNDQAVTPLTGRLTWDDDCTVRVFTPVAGRVQKIAVDIGQEVKVNQPLCLIESPDFGQAQADAVKADADLKLSDKTLARTKDLFSYGAAAKKDVEAAEDDLAAKKSEQQRALKKLSLYGGGSGDVDEVFPLKSPIAGEVVEKNINPGQEVRPDAILGNIPQAFSPLFVISDPTKLCLYLDVSENDIGKLRPGQALRVQSRAYPGKVFHGLLEIVGRSLDPATRTVKARAYVDNSDKLLRSEMYVSAELVDLPAGGVMIPTRATFRKDDQEYVFIEKVPGEYERRQIKLGGELGDHVVVLEGLENGDRVVTQGGLALEKIMETNGEKGT